MLPRLLAAAIAFTAVTAVAAPAMSAQRQPEIIPAKTALRFHLTQALSSDRSTTGQPFTFVMFDPVMVDGAKILAAGATGTGTLLLAGHAGTSGHEGDLTLRLDTILTTDGSKMVFDDQRLRINGKNEKVLSGVLGFIPYAGFGARFIRGREIQIAPSTPITTVLDHVASTANPLPTPMPVPSKR
jgi:hypothetical protein